MPQPDGDAQHRAAVRPVSGEDDDQPPPGWSVGDHVGLVNGDELGFGEGVQLGLGDDGLGLGLGDGGLELGLDDEGLGFGLGEFRGGPGLDERDGVALLLRVDGDGVGLGRHAAAFELCGDGTGCQLTDWRLCLPCEWLTTVACGCDGCDRNSCGCGPATGAVGAAE